MSDSSTTKAAYLPLVLSCVALLAAQVSGQNQKPDQKPDEVVRVETGLVQTDVTVLDKNRRSVKGLKSDQFRLQVNHKSREILFFEPVLAGSVNEDARMAAARGRSSGSEARTFIADRGRTIYFYLDDYHLSAKSTQHTRELLTQFIKQIKKAEDEITIVTATGQLGFLEQPARDNVVLQKAIASFGHRNFTSTDAERTPMSEHQARSIVANDRRTMDYFVDQLHKETTIPRPRGPAVQTRTRTQIEAVVLSRARAIVDHLASYTAASLVGLDRLMRSAAAVPDRKILFLISDGFLLDKQQVTEQAHQQISDAAARSGTVIYAIDATGLSSGSPNAATRMTFDNTGRLMSTNLAGLNAAQQPLYALAVDTGGRAFLNTNTNITVVQEALQETAEYYLIAWRPEEDELRSGKYQTIDLNIVNQPDLHVRVRDGFMAANEPAKPGKVDNNSKKKAPDPLASALHSIFPQKGLPVSLALGYLDTPEKLSLVTATIEVGREALENQSGELDVLGTVINEQGKSINNFDQGLTITGGGQRLTYNHQLQLLPGLYQIRVAVRDKKGGKVGSASEWIAVPNLKDGSFALSSLFIGEMNADAFATGKLPINADHRFRSNSRLGFFTYVYNSQGSGGDNDVALQIHILRDDQPVITRPSIKLEAAGAPDPTRIAFGEDLSLADLPAGRYLLRVTAVDRLSKKTASQVSRFTIY
ncbi:MAG: VWA domain-containing protein [Acidobacteriota bacterium]|nr:VWA domain-containing protein [Acidobacteriota bacterium]